MTTTILVGLFVVVVIGLLLALVVDITNINRRLTLIDSRLGDQAFELKRAVSRVDPETIEASLREARRNARRARKEASS